MPYSTVSGVRELIPFVTSSVMSDATVSGHILRADGDINAWLRPVFQTPFTGTAEAGTIDKALETVSEAFAAAYCLSAYTGQHLSNRTEKIDEMRNWGADRLNMFMARPEMLTTGQHPVRSAYDSHEHNTIMFFIPSNVRVIDINKSSEEWVVGSRSKQQV